MGTLPKVAAEIDGKLGNPISIDAPGRQPFRSD
jgi:hypothetical protein